MRLPFSPCCGRKWPREARSDEGCSSGTHSAPSSNRLGAARQSTARGESRASPALRAPQGEKAERGSDGLWSRRIIQDHRLVYRAAASLRSLLRPGNDEGAGGLR
ncbi:MAG: hypothetical protein EOS14_06145 [Mesorhizobium sp.]|nr:MAG: hypothetical protein EOS14_06145 [Mesorhizobium sp.]